MRDIRWPLPVWVITAILAVQALLLYRFALTEVEPRIIPLATVESRIGDWQQYGEDVLDTNIFNILKPDDYISRQYKHASGTHTLDLFVAYFKSLNQSYGPHSPRVCLPGAGWLTRASGVIPVDMPSWSTPVSVNEIEMEKNNARILVFYWYQNQRHAYADEVMAKFYLLPDMLRHQRADIALVRVVTPADTLTPERRQAMLAFMRSIFPMLLEKFSG